MPSTREQAQVPLVSAANHAAETRGLMIQAAAHFPLGLSTPDAILVGGILLNRNFPLIEHMREIIFPVGTLPGDAEGTTALFIDGVRIAISRHRQRGHDGIGQQRDGQDMVQVGMADADVVDAGQRLGGLCFGRARGLDAVEQRQLQQRMHSLLAACPELAASEEGRAATQALPPV